MTFILICRENKRVVDGASVASWRCLPPVLDTPPEEPRESYQLEPFGEDKCLQSTVAMLSIVVVTIPESVNVGTLRLRYFFLPTAKL